MSWNPNGCAIEYAVKKRGRRKWKTFFALRFSLNDAVARIDQYRAMLPECVFRVRVP